MKTIIHKSNSRGHSHHGWPETWHSFRFAGYQNPKRVCFGKLRVLNDDIIRGGVGFDTHPHNNMETITCVPEGHLMHKNSMGNSGVISANKLQVKTAGKGIQHSEYNGKNHQPDKLLQIWIFPRHKNLETRHQHVSLKGLAKEKRVLSGSIAIYYPQCRLDTSGCLYACG